MAEEFTLKPFEVIAAEGMHFNLCGSGCLKWTFQSGLSPCVAVGANAGSTWNQDTLFLGLGMPSTRSPQRSSGSAVILKGKEIALCPSAKFR